MIYEIYYVNLLFHAKYYDYYPEKFIMRIISRTNQTSEVLKNSSDFDDYFFDFVFCYLKSETFWSRDRIIYIVLIKY